jgi:hypothetical protein
LRDHNHPARSRPSHRCEEAEIPHDLATFT